MRRLLPDPSADLGLRDIAAHYAHAPSTVRANMVASADGAATVDGQSRSLSLPPDRLVFRVLRAHADVVLVGAGTARAEGYGPAVPRPELAFLREGRPTAPCVAVVTRTGDLDPTSRLFADGAAAALVVTCEEAVGRLRARLPSTRLVVCGDGDVDLPDAVRQLHALGLTRILTEGGPRLLGHLLDHDLVDELALTTSPTLVGGDSQRIVSGPTLPPRPLTLAGLLEEADVLLALYRRSQ